MQSVAAKHRVLSAGVVQTVSSFFPPQPAATCQTAVPGSPMHPAEAGPSSGQQLHFNQEPEKNHRRLVFTEVQYFHPDSMRGALYRIGASHADVCKDVSLGSAKQPQI